MRAPASTTVAIALGGLAIAGLHAMPASARDGALAPGSVDSFVPTAFAPDTEAARLGDAALGTLRGAGFADFLAALPPGFTVSAQVNGETFTESDPDTPQSLSITRPGVTVNLTTSDAPSGGILARTKTRTFTSSRTRTYSFSRSIRLGRR